MNSRSNTRWDASDRDSRSRDRIGTGTGLALIGLGLLGLAGAEATRVFLDARAAATTVASERTAPAAQWAAAMPIETAIDPDPQAVGAGRGAPSAGKSQVPPASGALVGIAANPIPNGTAIYRLWSSGRVEAMITTEENVWGRWVPVAPGLSTDMRRPRAAEDPDNPN
jgi:hypothetical protein